MFPPVFQIDSFRPKNPARFFEWNYSELKRCHFQMDGWPSGFTCLSTPMGMNIIPSEITATSQDLTPDGAVVGEASDKWPNIYGNRPKTHLILCIKVASRCLLFAPDCSRKRCAKGLFFRDDEGMINHHFSRKYPLPVFQGEGCLEVQDT